MEVRLVVVGGQANKGEIRLKLPAVVGRSRGADLTVAHAMISRRHCELFDADGMVLIRDLGSLNGTVVDGHRVKEAPLRPDAEFTVGPITFRAVYQFSGDTESFSSPIDDGNSISSADGFFADASGPEERSLEEPPAGFPFFTSEEGQAGEVSPPAIVAPSDGNLPDFSSADPLPASVPPALTTGDGPPPLPFGGPEEISSFEPSASDTDVRISQEPPAEAADVEEEDEEIEPSPPPPLAKSDRLVRPTADPNVEPEAVDAEDAADSPEPETGEDADATGPPDNGEIAKLDSAAGDQTSQYEPIESSPQPAESPEEESDISTDDPFLSAPSEEGDDDDDSLQTFLTGLP